MLKLASKKFLSPFSNTKSLVKLFSVLPNVCTNCTISLYLSIGNLVLLSTAFKLIPLEFHKYSKEGNSFLYSLIILITSGVVLLPDNLDIKAAKVSLNLAE